MSFNAIAAQLREDFTYTADAEQFDRKEHWREGVLNGPFAGDCDDFAMSAGVQPGHVLMSAYTELEDWCEHVSGIDYVTTKELTFDIGYSGNEQKVTVPPGTRFNGSIPWPLWLILNPHDPRFLKAFAVHDYVLHNGWDRQTAGGLFHSALLANGAWAWERMVMFLGVTLWRFK